MRNRLTLCAAGVAAVMTMGAWGSLPGAADPNASAIQLSPAQAPDRAASTTEGVVTLPGIGGAVDCVCGGIWSVGDQVTKVADAGAGGPPIGSTGTVVCGIEPGFPATTQILVCWDGFATGHDGNGFCACPGEQLPPGSTCGWYVACADIAAAGAGCVCDQQFEVGDKVELLEDFEGGPVPGSLGTVICGRFFGGGDDDLILVYWEDFLGGHDGFGACDCPTTGLPAGSTSGWYVPCDHLASFKCPKNINVDLSPGTAAPPASLGPYLMTAFPADTPCPPDMVGSVASPLGGSVGFSMALSHRSVDGGPVSACASWGTWSHFYTGDVYFTGTGFAGPLTLTMPPDTGAFYLYVESNAFGLFEFVATANDGTSSGPILVEGSAGARYIGFYAAGGGLNTITITQPGGGGNGFSVGEFGIAPQGQVIFDGSPGTAAPPAMLGPYVMDKFPTDTPCPPDDVTSVATPLGQPLFFSAPLGHSSVAGGPPSACASWGTWSHGYTGDVYVTDGTSVTLTMPPQTGAFYLYVEPNLFGLFEFVVETDSGTSSGTVNIEGSAGARYFGFWGAGGGQIVSITVTNTDGGASGFAVGEFGIAEKACNKTCAADLNGDGFVNGFDLALLLGDWTGAALYAPCPPHVNADLNGDCRINGFDLALLLGLWGPCEF